MIRTLAVIGTASLVALGCQRAATVESTGSVTPSVSVPENAYTIPSGTTLHLKLNEELGTQNSKVGDRFTATVATALRAQNGALVVPEGSTVHGTVTALKESDNATEQAAIRLNFDRITVNGRDYPIDARIERADVQQSGETRSETIKKAGIGAAAGAVLGAIIGDGDLGNILGGAALGAAAGTVVSLGMGDVNASLPAGTDVTIRLNNTVSLR